MRKSHCVSVQMFSPFCYFVNMERLPPQTHPPRCAIATKTTQSLIEKEAVCLCSIRRQVMRVQMSSLQLSLRGDFAAPDLETYLPYSFYQRNKNSESQCKYVVQKVCSSNVLICVDSTDFIILKNTQLRVPRRSDASFHQHRNNQASSLRKHLHEYHHWQKRCAHKDEHDPNPPVTGLSCVNLQPVTFHFQLWVVLVCQLRRLLQFLMQGKKHRIVCDETPIAPKCRNEEHFPFCTLLSSWRSRWAAFAFSFMFLAKDTISSASFVWTWLWCFKTTSKSSSFVCFLWRSPVCLLPESDRLNSWTENSDNL